jgi:hypothetical protein
MLENTLPMLGLSKIRTRITHVAIIKRTFYLPLEILAAHF